MYRVPNLDGRRYVVTGGNSGTGREAVRRLSGAGAEVVLAVRSTDKGEAARAEIVASSPAARIDVRHLDLADLATVRAFADGLLAEDAPLHGLVNNAGVMAPHKRFETADGFELQFGTNFLGHFALTNLLLPKLLQADSPRVATMSSGAANVGRIHFDDLQSQRRYSRWGAYAQSKLGNLLMAIELAALSDRNGWDLLSTAAHPGFTRTNLQTSGANLTRPGRERQPRARTLIPSQEPREGTEPLLFAIADPAAIQGGYYGPRNGVTGPTKLAGIPRRARRSPDLAASLWAVAETLTDTHSPADAGTAGPSRIRTME